LKPIISLIIRLAVTVLILALLFFKINFSQVIGAIASCDKPLLTWAFLLFASTYYLGLLRWRMFLHGLGLEPPFKKIVSAFSGGLFFNLTLPSTIGGDVARVYSLFSHTGEGSKIAATVILDRLSGFLALTCIAIVSVCYGYRFIESTAIITVTALTAGVFSVITLILFSRRSAKVFSELLSFFHLKKAEGIWLKVSSAINIFRDKKRLLFKNFLISCIIQSSIVIATYLVALSVGAQSRMIYFFVIVPVIGVISTLPITIGGLGLRDASSILFFSKIGIPSNIAFSISLISFSFVTILGVIGGLVYAFTLHTRRL
jgi:uncharacterized protein (TIRG00374 family)